MTHPPCQDRGASPPIARDPRIGILLQTPLLNWQRQPDALQVIAPDVRKVASSSYFRFKDALHRTERGRDVRHERGAAVRPRPHGCWPGDFEMEGERLHGFWDGVGG